MAMVSAHAQKTPVWLDPQVNQVNREASHAHFFAFENQDLAQKGDKAKSARFLSMEGMWKFNFVKDHQNAPEGFYALKYDDSRWVDFPVPGLFELNGYGDKIYKNIGYAWGTTFKSNPPYIGETNNYTGSYLRTACRLERSGGVLPRWFCHEQPYALGERQIRGLLRGLEGGC